MHQISKIYFVIKLYMFRASSMPIIRSYLLYTRQLLRFMQVMWQLPSRVRLEFQPCCVRKRSHNLHETYQFAECTVDNSWWWAQKMPETCRVLWQDKFWIFDAYSWLLSTKFKCILPHNTCTFCHYKIIQLLYSSLYLGFPCFRKLTVLIYAVIDDLLHLCTIPMLHE